MAFFKIANMCHCER